MSDDIRCPLSPLPPTRASARLAMLCLVLAGACTTEDEPPSDDAPLSDDAPVTPRIADPGEPCVQYCESRVGAFMERCEAASDGTVPCEELWPAALESCVQSQCSLSVEVPDPAGLQALAISLSGELLGPQYEPSGEEVHYWGPEEVGSRIYRFVSAEDGSDAFIELGASLEQPPIVSYGIGPTAEQARLDHAVERLSQTYGALGFTHVRSYFTATHPILEFDSPAGSYFYSVANDDVSDVFEIEVDPEADPMELAIRAEGFRREWSRYVP